MQPAARHLPPALGVALTFALALGALTPAPAGAVDPAADRLAAAAGLIQHGDAAAGARLLAARVATAPGDLGAQTYLTVALDRLAQSEDLEALEGVREVLPDWPPVLERLARVYDAKGRADDARGVYRTWVRLRPGNPEPYARLAEHEVAQGRYDRAIALFERHRVLVGDSETDVKCARAAGVPVLVVSFGYTRIAPRALGADAVIDHFDELLTAIESLNGR